MDRETRNSAIAAALILGGFGLLFYLMPTIMLAVGEQSTAVAGILAIVAVIGFFGVFWLRARYKDRK
ncbi:MAG: hypothetical protein KDJ74_12945 [Notoacmeibacter sp.]|nr:hypothetical protein [Notoacmeibacter sp.]